MKWAFDALMHRRATRLANRLAPFLASAQVIADVGCGTGHNARLWRHRWGGTVAEFDVVDMHWAGPAPTTFDGRTLPVTNGVFDVVTLIHVLHYARDAECLLRECARASRGTVVIVQSTFSGWPGFWYLRVRGWIWGRLGFRAARAAGLVRGTSCSLTPQTCFTRAQLQTLFRRSGLVPTHQVQPSLTWWPVRRDVYVLTAQAQVPTSQSSFPPAMKAAGWPPR